MAPSGLPLQVLGDQWRPLSGWLGAKHFTALVNLQDPDCIFPLPVFHMCTYNPIISKIQGAPASLSSSIFCIAPSSSNSWPAVSQCLRVPTSFPQFSKPTVLCLGFLFLDYSNQKSPPSGSQVAVSLILFDSHLSGITAASVQCLKIVVSSTAEFSTYLWWEAVPLS